MRFRCSGSSGERGDPTLREGSRFGHPEQQDRDFPQRREPRKAENSEDCGGTSCHMKAGRGGEWLDRFWALTSLLRSVAFQAIGAIV